MSIQTLIKVTFAWGCFTCLLAAPAHAAPGNFITVIYQGEEIFHDGGPRKHLEIPRLLYSINDEIKTLNDRANVELRAQILRQLPGSLDLDGSSVHVNRYVNFNFVSLGGGQFSAQVRGFSMYGWANFSLDHASWLADGRVDFQVSALEAAGTYDLYTGHANFLVTPPSVTLTANYGGLGAEFINFISFGYLDRIFDETVAGLELDINASIAETVAGLNTSITLFGIAQFIPPNLVYHGIDVTAEVMNAINDIPAGSIVAAGYGEGLNKYQAHLELSLGNNLTIRLDHHNPNGTCIGSCRDQ